VSGFRWSFYGKGDVSLEISLGFVSGLLAVGIATVWLIFKTGYRLKK
jgi:ABC-2 type transport system permease protein